MSCISCQVAGPNTALVQTGVCIQGSKVTVSGCTLYYDCCQELHAMDLSVMTIAINSPSVVTSEGVRISCEGVAQVRIDPGMAKDQITSMIKAKNDDVEHKMEEVIREKISKATNKDLKGLAEDVVIKGVQGVKDVKCITVTYADKDIWAEKYGHLGMANPFEQAMNEGWTEDTKKRLIVFVGPPSKDVVERVYAQCHRHLQGSGMCPYYVMKMPQRCDEQSYNMALDKLLVKDGWKEGESKRPYLEGTQKWQKDNPGIRKNLCLSASMTAYSSGGEVPCITVENRPTRDMVYAATGYYPGKSGPVPLLITEVDGQMQSFAESRQGMQFFNAWVEPKETSTVWALKEMLCTHSLRFSESSRRLPPSFRGAMLRQRVCDMDPSEMELVLTGPAVHHGQLVRNKGAAYVAFANLKLVTEGLRGRAGKADVVHEKISVRLHEWSIIVTQQSTDRAVSHGYERMIDFMLLRQCKCELDGSTLRVHMPSTRKTYELELLETAEGQTVEVWEEKLKGLIANAAKAGPATPEKGRVLDDEGSLSDYSIGSNECLEVRRRSSKRPASAPRGGGGGPIALSAVDADGKDMGGGSTTSPLMPAPSGGGATLKDDDIADLEDCQSHEGDVGVRNKLSTTVGQSNLKSAAAQFVSKTRDDIKDMIMQTLEGHQRAIMAEMTVEEIYKARIMFQRKVREKADVDMAKMGLRIMSYTLKEVSDENDYMNSLGVRKIQEVKKHAEMGKAVYEADKDKTVASLNADVEKVMKANAEVIANEQKLLDSKLNEYRTVLVQAEETAKQQYKLTQEAERKKVEELKGAVDVQFTTIQTEIDKLERQRREFELAATVRLVSDSNLEKTQAISTAEKDRASTVNAARAAARTVVAEAEAQIIKAKGTAMADVMSAKAAAWSEYGENAYLDMVVDKLPEITRNFTRPLERMDKIVMINGDGSLGASKITAQVAKVMDQIPDVVASLTGVNLKESLRRSGAAAP